MTLFSDMNCGLTKVSLWFKANILSLNWTKAKYFLFHPASKKKKKKKRFLREPLPLLKTDNISLKEKMLPNVLLYLLKPLMGAAYRRCQHRNIKKHWYSLQNNSKTTFIKTIAFFFHSLSFELCKYYMDRHLQK